MSNTSKKLHRRLIRDGYDQPTEAEVWQSPDVKDIETLFQDGIDPIHAPYVAMQHVTSYFAEGVSELPEMKKYAKLVQQAEDGYMPSGPPTSPLTNSYFTSWAFFDLQFDGRDTLASCMIEVKDMLGLNSEMCQVVELMSTSRMGIYEHVGVKGRYVRLRELITEDEFVCLCPAGYKGRKGELWYVRRLPSVIPGVADYHILFTTPYILVKTKKDDWMQFLRRTMLKVEGADDREKLHRLLKYGLSHNYWNEFVFQAYHHHQFDAIFLAGIPDLKGTLPHG